MNLNYMYVDWIESQEFSKMFFQLSQHYNIIVIHT